MELTALTVAILALKLFFSGLFAVAGVHKLTNRAEIAAIVADYRLLPAALSGIAAALLSLAELVAAALILVPAISATGMALAAGLLTVYLFALASVLIRDIQLCDCGCGGPLHSEGVDAFPVWRNVVLIALAMFVLLKSSPVGDAGISVWAIVVPLAAFVLLIYWVIDGLWANHRKLSMIRAHYE